MRVITILIPTWGHKGTLLATHYCATNVVTVAVDMFVVCILKDQSTVVATIATADLGSGGCHHDLLENAFFLTPIQILCPETGFCNTNVREL